MMIPKNQNSNSEEEKELANIYHIARFFKKTAWLLIATALLFLLRLSAIAQDTTPPNVSITSAASSTNNPSIDFSIVFTEATNGFTQADLMITNGAINSLSAGTVSYTYSSTLGTTGMGGNTNALLNGPSGIAIDSNGNILVVDRNNHRIQVFNSAGVYQSTIGTGIPTTNNTGFSAPWGIAVGSQGNVYISDAGNHRIQVYNSSLVYQATIGTGTAVNDNTGFNSPTSVTTDTSGNLYVADQSNHRIQVYDNTNAYVATIGTGAAVNDNTGFNTPRGVAVDASGNVYVADLLNQRVQVFGSNPTYTYSNTLSGLTFPTAVAVKGNGELYVLEQLAHRLRVYDNTLTQIGTVVSSSGGGTGSGSGNDQLHSPLGVTLGSTGEIYIADASNHRVQVFNTSETYTVTTTAMAEGDVTLTVPAMVATDGAGNQNTVGMATVVYDLTGPTPAISTMAGNRTNASFNATIAFPEAINNFSINDLVVNNGTISNFLFPSTNYRYTRTLSNLVDPQAIDPDVNPDDFDPEDVAVANNGTIYIVDSSLSIAYILDAQGNLISSFGTNELSDPGAIALDASGNIFVVDRSNSQVYKFSNNGTLLSSFGGSQMDTPTEITIDNSGNIFVTDEGNSEVYIYDASLNFIANFGGNELSSPVGIAIDNAGNKYVLDTSEEVVAIYSSSNTFVSSFMVPSESYHDMVINADGNLVLLGDSPLGYIYTISGNQIATFGSSDLSASLVGAGLDNLGNLYVIDNGNLNEIDIFSSPTTAYTATITPTMEGIVTIDVPANAVSDLAGNLSNAANQLGITFDQTAPTVVLSTTATNPSAATSFTITAQFNEEVTGLTIDDFTIGNGSASNFISTNASTYSIDIAPGMDGNVTIDLATAVATDLAGNNNLAATQLVLISDRFIPEVSLFSRAGTITNDSPFEVIVTFSEPISGFDISDVSVTNSTLSNFVANNTDYLYLGTIGSGNRGRENTEFDGVTGTAIDASGNIYVVDGQNSRVQVFDSNRNYIATMGVTGLAGSDNARFNSPTRVAIDASGNIYISDLGNHRIQVFDSNRNYIATMGTSGAAQTDNTGFSSPLAVAVDDSGNIYVSDSGNQRVQIFDSNRNYIATMGTPGVAQTDNTGFFSPRGIDFDSSGNIYITDYTNERIQVFDSNRNYVSTIGDNNSGNFDFRFPQNVAIDELGNIYVSDDSNHRIQVFNQNHDYIGTIGTSGQQQSNNSGFTRPVNVSIDALGRIYVSDSGNYRVQIFQRPMDAYIFSVTPSAEGVLTLDIPAGAATDGNNNANLAAPQLMVEYDISGPTATFQGPGSIGSDDPFTLTFNFNEPVFGFSLSDLNLNNPNALNATVASFTMLSPSSYSVEVTPDGSTSDITITMPNVGTSGVIQDALGNFNQDIETIINYDLSGPVLDIQNEPAAVNNTAPFNITFEFDEDVTGFTIDDPIVTNGVLSNLVMVDGNTFTADLTPDGMGNIAISLPAATVTDGFGNPNTSSFPVTILLDNTGPSLTMSTPQNPGNNSTFDVSITFDETIAGFDQTDLMITNGALNSLAPPSGQYVYKATIGERGSGNGSFNFPTDIAFDGLGNIYVSDGFNHRVQIFDMNRNFVAAFGSIGTATGQFSLPAGIALDQNGLIYVADQNNHRIQVFDANYNFLSTFGSLGSATGQFSRPSDVFVDAIGRVYVADVGNSRVQVFDSNFNHLFSFSPGSSLSGVTVDSRGQIFVTQAANVNSVQVFDNSGNFIRFVGEVLLSGGSGNNQFNRPEGVFVASNGSTYVADSRNDRVQVFDVLGNYSMTIGGGPGNSNDQLNGPVDVAIHPNGDLFIIDLNNARIQVFSAPVETYTANITAMAEGTVGISVPANSLTDLAGNANTTGAALDVVVDNTPPTVTLTASVTIATAPFEVTAQFSEAIANSSISTRDFLVINGRVSSLTRVDADTYTVTVSPIVDGLVTIDMDAGSITDLAGNGNIAVAQLSLAFDQGPASVLLSTMEPSPTTNAAFNVSIDFSEVVTGFDQSDLTISNGTITAFMTPNGTYQYLSTLGISGQPQTDNTGFNNPIDIAIDPSGNIYVADQSNRRVQVFDDNGNYLATMGTSGQIQTDNTGFRSPFSITIDANGKIYIVDLSNHRVQVFDADRNYMATLGTSGVGGSDNARFNNPQGVAVDLAGNIYVADGSNERVQVFDASFNYIFTIDNGNSPNALLGVRAIHVDASGVIYITTADNTVEMFDQSGNFLFMLGTFDQTQTDNTGFDNPRGVTTDHLGNIYIADRGNQRIQVYGSDRKYKATIGTSGIAQTDNTGFGTSISGVEFTSRNQLYIADANNDRVQIYKLPTETYQATVQATADGLVTASVNSGASTDAAGTANAQSNSLSVTVDINPPGLSITSLAGTVTNVAFSATFQFTEAVTGFDVTDITAGNGTLSNFVAVDSDTYTVSVTPTTTGQVTLDVGAAVAQDIIGNDNVAASQFSRTFNPAAFTSTLNTMSSSPTNSNFDITLSFDRRTTGFAMGDFTVNNGTLSNFTGQTISYAFGSSVALATSNITTPFGTVVSSDGLVFVSGNNRIEVYNAAGTLVDNIGLGSASNQMGQFNDPRGMALDASGNLYVADRLNHRIQVFNSGSFSFQQQFGSRGSGDNEFEFPSGVAVAPNGNILVADENNERVQIFDANFNYIATIGTTATQGNTNALLRRPDDVFVDRNGRIYIADTNNDRIQIYNIDLSFFGTIGTGSSGSGNDAFNDPTAIFVDGLGDIYVVDQRNHRVQIFNSDLSYKQTLGTGTSESDNTGFNNPAAVATDILGSNIYTVDRSNNRIQVFDVNQSSITATINPLAEGSVMVNTASGTLTDGAGNVNAGSDILEIIYDITAPTVDIQDEPIAINNTSFTVTFEFNEAVTGFDVNDINTGNASVGTFAVVDANTYTAQITPNGAGNITVDVAAGVATDLAGNGNIAAVQAVTIYDITPPDITISTLASDATNAPFVATFGFTEVVTGFTSGDITVANATISGFSGTGNTYSATITPIAEGQVRLDVAADLATDAAGNGNTVASQLNIIYDITAPTVTLIHNIPPRTSATAQSVSSIFSEPVTGFTTSSISVTNGSVPFLSGNNFQIAPAAEGVVTFEIPAASVFDAAGNGNTASAQITFISDQTGPTVSFDNVPTIVNGSSSFTIRVIFNEDADNVTVNEFQVVNGSATNVTGSGNTYLLEITPDNQGDITISTHTGLRDVAGNSLTNSAQVTVVLDNIAPDVSLTSTVPQQSNLSSFPVSITFTEAITDLTLADIIVNNGTPSNLTGSGANYMVDIAPIAEGILTVDILADAVVDVALNGNTASNQLFTFYDITAPTALISTTANDPTNEASISVSIIFDENVSGLEIGDITVTNGTATNLTGEGMTYTVDISPSTDGVVTVALAAQVVVDAAGNSNVASNTLAINSDQTRPGVTISTTSSSPTNQGSFTTQFTFSESVTGFDMGDVAVSNGTLSNFAGTGDTYSATVTATADGPVTVDIAENVVTDAASNGNPAASQLVVNIDTTGPTITIGAPGASNGTAFTATFTFNEAVTDFVATDISVSNATLTNFMGSGTNYTADITPVATGTVTIDVAASAASDALGNLSSAAAQVTVISDLTAPTVSISSTAISPTGLAVIPLTFTFSETVIGFDQTDLSISNGSITSFTGSGATYTASITPTTDGNITVDLATGSATDEAGNSNTAAGQFSILSDRTAPSTQISTNAASPNNAASFGITIVFGETVTGFGLTDIDVNNGAASNLAGSGTTYTADIAPVNDGTVTIDIAGSVAMDAAGNGNLIAPQLVVVSDRSSPTVTISTTATSTTNAATIPVTFTFNEAVTGFDATDITIDNGSADNFVATSAMVYTAEITPLADGVITLDIATGVAIDEAGNGNITASQLEITSDRTAPTLTISTAVDSPTNASTIPVTFTFNEAITSFDVTDITIFNGSADNFMATSAMVYTADITPAADGTITVDVFADVGTDAANNGNTGATQLSLISDQTAPSISLLSNISSRESAPLFNVTITSSEPLIGFDISDVQTSNAVAQNFDGNNGFFIAPIAEGFVSFEIPVGAVTDAAGNGNIASNQISFTSDQTGPTVSFANAPIAVNSLTPFSIDLIFNEDAGNVTVNSFQVSNGTPTGISGNGSRYILGITPDGMGDITVLTTPSNGLEDLAGNSITNSAQVDVIYDATPPAITISTQIIGATNLTTFPVTFTFDETVTGFDITDIAVSNGTVSNFIATSTTLYTAEITPTTDGVVTINVSAGAAIDIAANDNTSATEVSITSDQTAPEVTEISRLDSNPIQGTSIRYSVVFSEIVTDIETSDFELVTTGTVTASIASVSVSSGLEATVTIDGISGNGTLGLNITDLTDLTDTAGNDLTAVFTGEVYNTNAIPTDITLSSTSIAENNSLDALIGSLGTVDPDAGDTFTYTLVTGTGDSDNAAFYIDAGSDLRAEVVFDFETRTSYSIRLQTEDSQGATFAKVFSITITNIAEPQIAVNGDPLIFSTAANPTPIGLTAQLAFTITNDGDGDLSISGVTAPARFTSDFTSGVVAAGSSQSVTVTFAPDMEQVYSGDIIVNSDAGDVSITVNGVGAIVTSVDVDIIDDSDVRLFPNPATQFLKLDLQGLNGLKPDIRIYDLNGLELFLRKEVPDSELTIDVRAYNQGVYIVTIDTQKGTIQKKVIIKR